MATPNKFTTLFNDIVRDTVVADRDIREGRFQKSLALIAGLSSVLSGLEVAYEHYRGSYGQRIMYSPVILSPLLLIAGVWGFFNKRAARTVLPAVSGITLLDGLIGFVFHVRGIQRKPGGWRVPIANLIMGPPVFAPLLFGISGYLGVIAAFLRREDAPDDPSIHPAAKPVRMLMELRAPDLPTSQPPETSPQSNSWAQDIREGRFQKHLAIATAAASFFSGVEALYSHYKNNFRYAAQWSPVILSPLLSIAAIGTLFSRRAAKIALPIASLLAMADGAVGFFYHARGILRRPGGLKLPLYNLIYGPPLFAPLLFAACGALGLLASLMRREK